MKNQLFVFALFFAITVNLFSQTENGSAQANTSSYITLSPFSLFDPYAPRLRFGYVQHVADHWKIGLDLSVGGSMGLFTNREWDDGALFEIRPEVYYIIKPESRTIKYLSAEFFYIDQSVTLLNDSYDPEEGTRIEFDRADFDREKYGMHFKFGLFLNTGRHWGFNFYGGVGFRWRKTSFTDLVNPVEGARQRRRHGFETIYDAERNDFRPNPSLGAKVYYRF